jgi:hypothetical protein
MKKMEPEMQNNMFGSSKTLGGKILDFDAGNDFVKPTG